MGSQLDEAALLDLVQPTLYDHNLFRLLQMPVDAAEWELLRRHKVLGMAKRLGSGVGPGPAPIFPLPASADDDQALLLTIRTPVQRFIHELFWFWPGKPDQASGRGYRALQEGDEVAAYRAWVAVSVGEHRDPVCVHNLAILKHIRAVEAERAVMAGRPVKGTRQQLWRNTLRYWTASLSNEGYWRIIEDRVRKLADPRLPQAYTMALREGLPLAIAGLNASFASMAAQRGDAAGVEFHLYLLRTASFGSDVIQKAFHTKVKAIAAYVGTLCEQAWEIEESDPNQLLVKAEGALVYLTAALSEEHSDRSAAYQQVGSTAFGLLAETEADWGQRVEVLEKILKLTKRDTERELIEEELDTARSHQYVNQVATMVEEIAGSKGMHQNRLRHVGAKVIPQIRFIERRMGRESWAAKSVIAIAVKLVQQMKRDMLRAGDERGAKDASEIIGAIFDA